MYTASTGRAVVVEPFRATLLVLVDLADVVGLDAHVEANSLALSRDADELRVKLAKHGPRAKPEDAAALRAIDARLEAARALEAAGAPRRWALDGRELGVGPSANLTLATPGARHVLAVSDDATGRVVLTGTVRCEYARRDLNELTPGDRAALFTAVRRLYEIAGPDGRAAHGPKFHSMAEVWAAHALLGGDGEDHRLLRDARADAGALLEGSEPYRQPSYTKRAQGHNFAITSDENDWEALGRQIHEQLEAPGTPEGGGGARQIVTGAAPEDAARNDALQSTGHDALGIATNFASFTIMFEEALQSVDASIALPFWQGADTREIPTATWTEKFVARNEDGEGLEYLEGAPPVEAIAASVSIDGEQPSAELVPTADSKRFQVTIEGKWAYVPILDRPTPSDPSRPNAGMDYKGVAMPIMIVEAGEDGSKRREHEVHEQLPPIVSDHHHDDLAGHEGIHQHHHGGRAHRHRVG